MYIFHITSNKHLILSTFLNFVTVPVVPLYTWVPSLSTLRGTDSHVAI